MRAKLLTAAEADQLYAAYLSLPISYIDTKSMRLEAWQLDKQYGMTTLYDAAFLACAQAEVAQFWTASDAMLNQFTSQPAYVHRLRANDG